MPEAKSRQNPTRKSKTFLLSGGLLLVILCLFFYENFEPGLVAFSNDGPLGQQAAHQILLPQTLTGEWDDLNSIGIFAGATPLNISAMIRLAWEWPLGSPAGPLGFSNSYVPAGLFILGLGALVFFYQLRFSPLAALLGALAAMLNATFFGGASWGVAAPEIALGFNFLALALVMVKTDETPPLICWIRFALAGLCVGVNVMETPDIGALASLFVAAFVFFKSFGNEEGSLADKATRGVARVAVVAVFALLIAFQAVNGVVTTAITGVVGTGQDAASKAAHWDDATQWSLPKVETFGLFVPGLFGYKMDTPGQMPDALQGAYAGGVYWGAMGRLPADERFLESGAKGSPPDPNWMRQTGNGNYCGVFVTLLAIWTIAQSFRRENSPFSANQKRFIWFWSGVLVLSLLLAWGKFAPFYALLYKLPYFSTIRSPTKFIMFFSWALIILFAYGLDALSRTYLNPAAKPAALRDLWKNIGDFDRKCFFTFAGVLGLSLMAGGIYAGHKPQLVKYLEKVGFASEDMAGQIAAFSIAQAGWFIVLLAIIILLVTLITTGFFGGSRAKIGGTLLVAFMLFDFVRADLPYVIHWDYVKKYEIGSLNPIESHLLVKPYEHRVAILPFDGQNQLPGYDNYFGGLGVYRIEWAQQTFPFYNIQSLDIIQMPRMPEDLAAYYGALSPRTEADAPLYARLWELTNTRYLIGATGFINLMNRQLDPGKERFQIAERFDVAIKTNVTQATGSEDLTVVSSPPSPDGALAVFDFTGALPRAKLYSNWQVNTNDEEVLSTLANLQFDPAKTVLVSTPQKDFPAQATNANTGTVEFANYDPKDVVLDAKATTPSILLLNDRYDPHWRVTVDGQPASLLRCNFIMRGVYLTPGEHTVKFYFRLPRGLLFVTLFAYAVGLALVICLIVHERRSANRRDKKN